MQSMYYIGLDVRKRTISYCVKDGSGTIPSPARRILGEGRCPAPHARPPRGPSNSFRMRSSESYTY